MLWHAPVRPAHQCAYRLELVNDRGSVQVVTLTLFRQALSTPDRSYTVFTHLLDSQERVRGQRDQIPVGGERPTNGWVAG